MNLAMAKMCGALRGPLAWMLLGTSLASCTAPEPKPEDLVIEDEQDRVHGGALDTIPSAPVSPEVAPPQPEPPPAEAVAFEDRPRLRFVAAPPACATDSEADDACRTGFGGCGFDIVPSGFPGLAAREAEVVTLEYLSSRGPADESGTYELVWRSTEDDAELRRERVADGDDIGSQTDWGDNRTACPRVAEQTRKAVKRVDDELRKGWRTLPRLAVEMPLPEWQRMDLAMLEEDEELAEGEEANAPRRAAQRPVEAMHRNGLFVLRVRGVVVLHREANDWRSEPMEFGSSTPNLRAIYGDADRGIAVVTMDYGDMSCLSDSDVVHHVVKLDPPVFEAIEKRREFVRAIE